MASKQGARGAPRVVQPTLEGTSVDEFRGPQVCEIVGITYRQLDYWARTGLLRPEVADARGSGTQRRYSYRDLVRLKVIKSLLDAGVKLQTARKAVEYLKEDRGEEWANAKLVLDGPNSVLAPTDDALVDAVHHGQGVLNVVPLGFVKEELDAKIIELVPPSTDAPGAEAHPSRSAGKG